MFFDSHTHAHFAAFEEDWKEVIDRALKNKVWLMNVGTQHDTSARGIEVANLYKEGVYASVGLHPIHTEKSYHDSKELGSSEEARGFTSRGEDFNYESYKKLAENKKVVAIGECGLDYYRLGEETKKRQAEVFIKQVELAKEVGKPLMIHCRQAFGDLIELIRSLRAKLPEPVGVIHFFSGTKEDARQLLDLGFSFTFGGAITFPPRKGQADEGYDEIIKYIPVERILSETDAPYVTPVPYRGKRNEPFYVIKVVERLAELKGLSLEEMENQIFESSKKIFDLT